MERVSFKSIPEMEEEKRLNEYRGIENGNK